MTLPHTHQPTSKASRHLVEECRHDVPTNAPAAKDVQRHLSQAKREVFQIVQIDPEIHLSIAAHGFGRERVEAVEQLGGELRWQHTVVRLETDLPCVAIGLEVLDDALDYVDAFSDRRRCCPS